MKKITSLLFILVLFYSCKVTETPEFKNIQHIKIIDSSLKNFTIKAAVLFLNKNQVGGTLQAKNVHVFIDNIDVATISSTPFNVPKESEFTVPLKAVIPFGKVFDNNKDNLLENILKIISSKKVEVLITGKIRYSIGAFHYDYPINYTEKIDIKKL